MKITDKIDAILESIPDVKGKIALLRRFKGKLTARYTVKDKYEPTDLKNGKLELDTKEKVK